MYIDQDKLYKFIIDSGLISQVDYAVLKDQAEKNGQRIQDLLVSTGRMSENDFLSMQSYLVGIPFIDLSNAKIPVEILSLIPEPVARKHNCLLYTSDAADE